MTESPNHVLISGTGRAGTTFIMAVLTRCGVETGFDETAINTRTHYSHSGMECWNWSNGPLDQHEWPRVVKCCLPVPEFSDDVFKSIDHIIVPIRDSSAAAESRLAVQRAVGSPDRFPCGGLLPGDAAEDLPSTLEARHYRLCLYAAKWGISMTHLHYPRLIEDAAYLYEQVSGVLDVGTFVEFEKHFEKTYRPDWIHQRSDRDVWRSEQ